MTASASRIRPQLTGTAAMIAACYRDRAGRGDVQALVDLGDFPGSVDPEGARAAYQQAIYAGHVQALIRLGAFLHERFGDNHAALAVYSRVAENSGDPDLAVHGYGTPPVSQIT